MSDMLNRLTETINSVLNYLRARASQPVPNSIGREPQEEAEQSDFEALASRLGAVRPPDAPDEPQSDMEHPAVPTLDSPHPTGLHEPETEPVTNPTPIEPPEAPSVQDVDLSDEEDQPVEPATEDRPFPKPAVDPEIPQMGELPRPGPAEPESIPMGQVRFRSPLAEAAARIDIQPTPDTGKPSGSDKSAIDALEFAVHQLLAREVVGDNVGLPDTIQPSADEEDEPVLPGADLDEIQALRDRIEELEALVRARDELKPRILDSVCGSHVGHGKPTGAFTAGTTITLDPCDVDGVDNGLANVTVYCATDRKKISHDFETTDILNYVLFQTATSGGVQGVLLGLPSYPGGNKYQALYKSSDNDGEYGWGYLRAYNDS